MKVGDSSYQSKEHDGDGHQRDNWAEMHFCRISWRDPWSRIGSHRLPKLSHIRNLCLITYFIFFIWKWKKKKKEGSPWGLIEYLEKILNPSMFTVKLLSITTFNQYLNIDGIT